MKYFFNLVFFTCMFLFIIVSKVFPVAITDIRLTPLGIIRIDCGDWQQVTIAIDYHLRPMEPLPQTGWIEIWENDNGFWDEDRISAHTFTIPSGSGQTGTITVQTLIRCDVQNADHNCDFYGTGGFDDEHGEHRIYAQVRGKSTYSNTERVHCLKPGGGLGFLPPTPRLIPGEQRTMHCSLFEMIPGVNQINMTINYNQNYFSVSDANFDSSYYSLFDTLSVNYTTPGKINFFASSMYPCSASTQLGYITFLSGSNTPFGNYLVEIDSSTVFQGYSGPLHVQLGSDFLSLVPNDTISPIIDPYMISTSDSSVYGSIGAITDNYDSLPGYLEILLFLEDTLDIGYAVVNSDGSFHIGNQFLSSGLQLKIMARDGVGNTSFTNIVSIQKLGNIIPEKFTLSQNYPNPFNPTTNIKFDIAKSTPVKIVIYNLLGEEIKILVNSKLSVGSYKVGWDGTDYPSGVYFYKLETDEFTDVKKMVLLK